MVNRTSSTSSVEAAASSLPTVQQIAALAIAKLDSDLNHAIKVMRDDEESSDADEDAEVTLLLASEAVERMKAFTFTNYAAFAEQWTLASAAIRLVARTHSRPTSYFGRCLDSMRDDVSVLLGVTEYLQRQGPAATAP